MSYGLNLGWGRPTEDYIGFLGGTHYYNGESNGKENGK